MKANSKPVHPKRRIKSLHDLELEKTRLQFEILKVEERMKYDFTRVYDYFTLKHAFRIITHDLTSTGRAISNGFSYISRLFSKKKKQDNSADSRYS